MKFYLDGQEINRLTLEYFGGKLQNISNFIYLQNKGDAIANNINVFLYSTSQKIDASYTDMWFHYSDTSDEPGFDEIHKYGYYSDDVDPLNPKKALPIYFNFKVNFKAQNRAFDLLLKVYSEREPIILPITLKNTTP